MMTPRWINNRVVQGSSIFAKSNELLRHTDVMDFAASNERIGQWVGTEDSDKVLAKTLSVVLDTTSEGPNSLFVQVVTRFVQIVTNILVNSDV